VLARFTPRVCAFCAQKVSIWLDLAKKQKKASSRNWLKRLILLVGREGIEPSTY
jgi:hypothetical protein